MIDVVPLGIAAAVAAFVVGAALESWSRKQRLAAELAAAPATPPSLYPRINRDACICSGACITACPEGEVLALIDGRPRLVRGSACVGHTDCLRSCPTSAIELVLGSAERPIAVPVASGSFESTVPGLYVAGEITGMGLIHNAVAQGREAAASALAGAGPHDCELDLLIVGAGPAGIGAALEARRRGARYRIYEKADFGGAIRSYPRQKVVMTAPLDLPGFGKVKLRRTSKEALLELLDDVRRRAELPIVEHAEVTAIRRIERSLRVETRAGSATAHRVVLAIGRRGTPRQLGAPGDHLPHVVYAMPDPARHAGQPIAVVGGGDSAVETALVLAAQPGTAVTLVHRGKDFGRCKPDNMIALGLARAAGQLAVRLEATVQVVRPGRITISGSGSSATADVAAQLVVCCLGAELPAEWLRGLGIALRELRGEAIG